MRPARVPNLDWCIGFPPLRPALQIWAAWPRIASSFDSTVAGLHRDWRAPPLARSFVTHLVMMLRKRVRLIW